MPTSVVAGTARGADAVGNINAVAVVGTNTWDAWQAAKRLSVDWTQPANASQLNDATFIAQGTALLLIEQNMSLVARVAHRYLAMAKGAVVAEGRVDNTRECLEDLESHVMV